MQFPLIGKIRHPARWLIGLVAIGVIGGSIAVVTARQRLNTTQTLDQITISVQSEDLQVEITGNGTVVAVQTVNLSPKTLGKVAELFVEQGDRVTKGQLIARMENNDLMAQRQQVLASIAQLEARLQQLRNGNRPEEIAQAEASIGQAEAQVDQARSRLQLAQDRARRNRELQVQGAISRDRLDEVLNEERSAQGALEQAQARVDELQSRWQQLRNGARVEEIEQAVAQVAEAEARLQAIDTQIDDTLITAPFAGIITQKYAVAGAIVTPATSASNTASATSTSIVALASGLEVLADIPEVDIGQIKLGQTVEVRTDAYPDQSFQGKVRLIAPAAVKEQNLTSFQVRVRLVTGNQQLLSGMNTNLVFLGDNLENALVVPTVAIVTQEGKTGVYVPDGKKAKFQPVTIGPSIGTKTQILQGLKKNDRVFIDLPKDNRPKTEEDFS